MTEAKHAKEFSQKELMTVVAARPETGSGAGRNGNSPGGGHLAKYTHAPNLVILVENGMQGPAGSSFVGHPTIGPFTGLPSLPHFWT